MPLVFVHGVANRMGDDYEAGVANRDALFGRFLLSSHRRPDGERVSIFNPYWGDHGGRLHWGGASLPLEDFEVLGTPDDATMLGLYTTASPGGKVEADRAILDVAQDSFVNAVDLLWSAGAVAEPQQANRQEAEAMAAIGAQAWLYAEANPRPEWLDQISDDQEFITRLEREVKAFQPTQAPGAAPAAEWESLGASEAWGALRRGADRIRAAVSSFLGREASDRIRPVVLQSLANFLGDVFVYLHQQGEAGAIDAAVEEDLRAAAAERTDDDPLVVVAHSMGGNITYDLLTSTCKDVDVDLYVTVGTQIGFFEELKLFRSSDPKIPGNGQEARVPRLPNVKRWINIFDYSDFLGFEAGSIIEGVEDHSYRTGALLKAHSQYFLQPGFHERLLRKASGTT